MIEVFPEREKSDIGDTQDSIIKMILDTYQHLTLGDSMRGPVDAFADGKQVDFSNPSSEWKDGIAIAKSIKVNLPLNPNQLLFDESDLIGKYLHVYSCEYVHHEKLAMLKRHLGQVMVCIHPETFDRVSVKIDEEVISRFNYVIFRYAVTA